MHSKPLSRDNGYNGIRLYRTLQEQCDIWACIVPIALSIIIRTLYIGKSDIGADESYSLYYSQFSIGEIVRTLCQGDNPPLWEILLHWWIGIFGIGVISMRVLSLLFNVLTIIPIYLLGKHLSGKGLCLTASLLYTFSTFSVFLSHEGRVYSLVGMLAAWSAWLFIILLEKPDKVKWVAWITVNIFLMYSHYLSLWVIVVQAAIWIAIPQIRKSLGRGMLYAMLAILLLYCPIIPTLLWRFSESGMHGTWVNRSHGIDDLYSMICCFTNAPVTTVLALVLLAATGIKAIIRIIRHEFTIGPLMIVTLIWVIPLMVSFGLSFLVGFFLNRYFYFLLPIYLLSLAAYIQYLFPKRKMVTMVLSIILVVAMVASCKPDSSTLRYAGWKGDVSKVVHRMKEIKKKEKALIVLSPEWIDKQLVYYIDDNHETFQTQGTLNEPAFCNHLLQHGYCYDFQLIETDLHGHPAILIVHNNYQDISTVIQHLSTKGYYPSSEEKFQQMTLTLYLLKNTF